MIPDEPCLLLSFPEALALAIFVDSSSVVGGGEDRVATGVPEGYIGGAMQVVVQRMAPSRGDHFWKVARPRSLSGQDQLVTVFSAVSGMVPGSDTGRPPCASPVCACPGGGRPRPRD